MPDALPLSGFDIIERAYASIGRWPDVSRLNITASSVRLAGCASYPIGRRAQDSVPAGWNQYNEATVIRMPDNRRWIAVIGRFQSQAGANGDYPVDLNMFPEGRLPVVLEGGMPAAIAQLLADERGPVTAVVTAGRSGKLYFSGHPPTDLSLSLRVALRADLTRTVTRGASGFFRYPIETVARLETALRDLMCGDLP